jgi:hypothetical protein
MGTATIYIFPMPKKELEWEVIRQRATANIWGRSPPAMKKAARKAARKLLALPPSDENRLLVRRRG